MKKKVHFYNIQWDTDGEEVESLPEETTIDVYVNADITMDGADILSDKFGWCVNSFQFKILD
jgi:hypothetical protein